MSEKLPGSPEYREQHPGETEALKDHYEKTVEKTIEKGRHARHEHAEKLLHLQHEVKKEAYDANEHSKLLHEQHAAEKDERPMLINQELKGMAYRRTITRTQKHLKTPERVFSKLVHNPAVDTVSEVAGRSIARPSGILAGGIVAFIGSSIFLWFSKHYGYEYNFLLFAFLFAGGFMVGLLIELGLRSMRRARS